MVENINLSLFEDFFESSSPADYAKVPINVKDLNENKGIVAEIKKQDIRFKRQDKKWAKEKKKCGWDTKDY